MSDKKREEKFIVEGGTPLKGEVSASGAKNAAIKMIAASLLTAEEVILTNVPEIDDVTVMTNVASDLGVKVRWLGDHKIGLKADEVKNYKIGQDLSTKARSTIMFMGPLLGRFGQFIVGDPGGCRIGKTRPINRHLESFEKLGATIKYSNGYYVGSVKDSLKGSEIVFEKNTVMGTENILLSSVLSRGTTQIVNAAEEPEVNDLILMLNNMGGRIERTKDRTIKVEGVPSLHGVSHEIIPDRNEAVTFAIAAAVTFGDVVIKNVRTSDLTAFLAKLQKVGVSFESSKNSLKVWNSKEVKLNPISIETSSHPGFMTDWQQSFCVLLTLSSGISYVHDTIYINRFEFIKELNRMGAKIDVLHPSEAGFTPIVNDDDYDLKRDGEPLTVAKINGPTILSGKRLTISDLRAGATLVIAALSAVGRSEILGVEHIDRGYESFDIKLSQLGAKISRI